MAPRPSLFDWTMVADGVSTGAGSPSIGVRSRLAGSAARTVNGLSRRLGRGSGTVAGGRVGLALDPRLVERFAAGRKVALVTGTNGKTTTTRLLAVALEAGGRTGAVVTNATGSNMPPGHAAALASGPRNGPIVLEVDEAYVADSLVALDPAALVLLNLSRDQLDRTSEVRMIAGRWRAALSGADHTTVVANADDPLVVWGAGLASRVIWVGAGASWLADASGCPACGGTIEFSTVPGGGWHCPCGFARPAVDVWIEQRRAESTAVWSDGTNLPIELAIPGAFNRANALQAAVAAVTLGVDAASAFAAMAQVQDVAGRFTVREVAGVRTRLMLAKNPAGWSALLALVEGSELPVVLGINARIADGRDPSWLWDVAFEDLGDRVVVATGTRRLDLSVRLRYAGIAHEVVDDPHSAIGRAAALALAAMPEAHPDHVAVDFIGNYTAFYDLVGHR
jgi:lipid II isoglutaminyl synthase (glutamine-hydrolysing)